MSVREDAAGDLLEEMKEVLTERKQSDCVRLEISTSASDVLRSFLTDQRSTSRDELVYSVPGPLDLSAFFRARAA